MSLLLKRFQYEGRFSTAKFEILEAVVDYAARQLKQDASQFTQQELTEPKRFQQMKKEDLRALTPLNYSHATPCGTFHLHPSERMPVEETISA